MRTASSCLLPTSLDRCSRWPPPGGNAVPVTTLDRQTSHRGPAYLPDGRHFLFYASSAPELRGIYLGALDSQPTTRLTAADNAGVYLPAGSGPADAGRGSGWLLWVRAGTLVAQGWTWTSRCSRAIQ